MYVSVSHTSAILDANTKKFLKHESTPMHILLASEQ